jgi:hypothetical protein
MSVCAGDNTIAKKAQSCRKKVSDRNTHTTNVTTKQTFTTITPLQQQTLSLTFATMTFIPGTSSSQARQRQPPPPLSAHRPTTITTTTTSTTSTTTTTTTTTTTGTWKKWNCCRLPKKLFVLVLLLIVGFLVVQWTIVVILTTTGFFSSTLSLSSYHDNNHRHRPPPAAAAPWTIFTPRPPLCPITHILAANSEAAKTAMGEALWNMALSSLLLLPSDLLLSDTTATTKENTKNSTLWVIHQRQCNTTNTAAGDAASTTTNTTKVSSSSSSSPMMYFELGLNASATIKKSDLRKKYFCLPWWIVVDDWWTHHPWYKIGYENATHYCMKAMAPRKSTYLRELYQIQFSTTKKKEGSSSSSSSSSSTSSHCDQVFTKRMWQAGWGADMAHLVDGLLYAKEFQVPFQVYHSQPWHYASTRTTKNQKFHPSRHRQACPSQDMYCYFLPMTNCPPNPNNVFGSSTTTSSASSSSASSNNNNNNNNHTDRPKLEFAYQHAMNASSKKRPQPSMVSVPNRWLLGYATRSQTWLRKAVYDFSRTIPLTAPCTTIHVRRTDVVLHGQFARKYHDLEEYMALLPPLEDGKDGESKRPKITILLLTDDDTAIQEALTKYPPATTSTSTSTSTTTTPSYQWVYIPRPRFKGPEGGFENQIPSANPTWEVIVLLSELHALAPKCQTLIHSQSNFAEYLSGILLEQWASKKPPQVPIFRNVDKGKMGSDIYNVNHSLVKQ